MTIKPAPSAPPVPGTKPGRPTSGIQYPYFNLDRAIEVVQAIHERAGGACTPDQLASFLGYAGVRSGTYLTRVSAARLFGVIESDGSQIGITERGRSIISPVMPEDSAKGKVDAFLAVPLFAALYEKFRGTALPPEVGLKNLFEQQFKIVKDRISPALRVFYESAEQAGFFSLSGDRTKLIMPISGAQKTASSAMQPEAKPDAASSAPLVEKRAGGGGSGDGPLGIHPAIVGLLREMPQAGQPWPKAKKQRFLTAFQSAIDFIYPEQDEPSSAS